MAVRDSKTAPAIFDDGGMRYRRGRFVALGYIFLLIFAISDRAFDRDSWIWMASSWPCCISPARFCMIIAPRAAKSPDVPRTASVLKEDTEWLKNLDQTKRP